MSSTPDFLKHVSSRNFVVQLRVETGGRKGKTVTTLKGLPKNELFLKDLLKYLKQTCGAGGSMSMSGRDGELEVQGDHVAKFAELLARFDIKTK